MTKTSGSRRRRRKHQIGGSKGEPQKQRRPGNEAAERAPSDIRGRRRPCVGCGTTTGSGPRAGARALRTPSPPTCPSPAPPAPPRPPANAEYRARRSCKRRRAGHAKPKKRDHGRLHSRRAVKSIRGRGNAHWGTMAATRPRGRPGLARQRSLTGASRAGCSSRPARGGPAASAPRGAPPPRPAVARARPGSFACARGAEALRWLRPTYAALHNCNILRLGGKISMLMPSQMQYSRILRKAHCTPAVRSSRPAKHVLIVLRSTHRTMWPRPRA